MTDSPFDDCVIRKLIQWASIRDALRVVLLTSTRAIPGAKMDALSDYDVILVVDDINPFVDDHTWLNDFGEVLVGYWDPVHPDPLTGFDICANVIQYRDGLKIDFTLWPVSLLQKIVATPNLPAELDAGYRVLLDKDHLTKTMPPPTGMAYVPAPPSLVAYLLLINDFLSDAPYVAKCLWRKELLPAKWCLDCDMKSTYLRQVLEWRAEIDHAWSIPVGYLGKGLKTMLPSDIWTALESTYAGAEIADNWNALFSTMQLFRQACVEVGRNLGYEYPEQLHNSVDAYLERIRNKQASPQQDES
jgi:aminoglycoside 6-adenylyltransferase